MMISVWDMNLRPQLTDHNTGVFIEQVRGFFQASHAPDTTSKDYQQAA